MSKTEFVVGGVVLAAIGAGAYFYFKNKNQQAATAATAEQTAEQQQAAATQTQAQSAYTTMQTSVLAALNQNLSAAQTAAANVATPAPATAVATTASLAELEPTGGVVATAVLVSSNVILQYPNLGIPQLTKLIKTIQSNLLSADELNSINNELLFESGNYVGTLSGQQIDQACNLVLQKYHII